MNKQWFIMICWFGCVTVLQAQLSFESTEQPLVQGNGRRVRLADFNCDGNLDAFVDYWDSEEVYYGDGHGLFQQGTQSFPDPSIIGDLNKDGAVDVISGNAVWLNDGKGQYSTSFPISWSETDKSLDGGAIGDLNGDGHPDLWGKMYYRQGSSGYYYSQIFWGDGSGQLTDSGQKLGDGLIGTGELSYIVLDDFNKDGAIDAITSGWRWPQNTGPCPNHVWLNDGTGQFNLSQGLDEGGSHVHGLDVGDLNGDGWLDLVMALQDGNRSGRIYLNDGTGRLVAGINIGGQRGEGPKLIDFDNDGDLDLAMPQSRPTTRIWENIGDGTLRRGPALGSLCNWGMDVGDFNGDGKCDVFTVGHDLSGNTAIDASPQIWLNTTPWPDPNGTIENKTQGLRFKTIQGAVHHADPGDEIVIEPGIYHECLTLDKDLKLQSVDPNNPYTIGGTIIQGSAYRPALTMNDNSPACEIAGLTLRAGTIGMQGTATEAVLRNCRLMDNLTHGMELFDESDLYLNHCLITANGQTGITMHVKEKRSSLLYCEPVIEDCVVVQNGQADIIGGQPDVIGSIVSDEVY